MAVADLSTWRREIGSYYRSRLTGPNVEREYERRSSRAESRDLIATDAIANGAISVNTAHVIGTGLSMRTKIDHKALGRGMTKRQATAWSEDKDRRFEMWASSPFSDAGRRLDFYATQQLALPSMLASGDVFVHLPLMPARPDWPFRIATQLIEADLVSNPEDANDIPGRLHDGIVLDQFGAPEAAWVANRHPGTNGPFPRKWTRIPFYSPNGRRNLLHLYEHKRPGQVRGTPYLMPVICKLRELSRYSEAEIAKAVTTAMISMVVSMDPEAFQTLFAPNDDGLGTDAQAEEYIKRALSWDGGIRPNSSINLLPGETATPLTSSASSQFEPFFRGVVQQIAVGLELPFEVLMKHFTASYTASRAALLEAGRTFRRRRDNFDKWLCTPVHDEWLADEVAGRRISAPGFFADPYRRYLWSQCSWIGDGPGILDPLKEVQSQAMLIAEGLSTREEESIKYDGKDYWSKHAQRKLETDRRVKDGLEMALVAPEPAGAVSGRPPQAASRKTAPAPEPDDDSDSE